MQPPPKSYFGSMDGACKRFAAREQAVEHDAGQNYFGHGVFSSSAPFGSPWSLSEMKATAATASGTAETETETETGMENGT